MYETVSRVGPNHVLLVMGEPAKGGAERFGWRDRLLITLSFAISFRQWAYSALNYLYSVEADEGVDASLCAATGLDEDEYAYLAGWAMSATVTASTGHTT